MICYENVVDVSTNFNHFHKMNYFQKSIYVFQNLHSFDAIIIH